MAKRTPEEILAQREAWLARKAAREAGQDVPFQPPPKPGEVTETPTEPEDTEATPEPKPTRPEGSKSEAPESKRSPEEIRAQREAFLAARAAKAVGQAPASPPKPTEKTEPAPAAPTPKPKAATPAPKPAPKKQEPAPAVDPTITRRELLNYAWLASIALFAVETVGISLWFAFPNFKEGQFGGQFDLGPAEENLPSVNGNPIPHTDGKFWLVNLDTQGPNGDPRKGLLALYKVCTHLGCLYAWAAITNRFECPCHGSKFALTGDYLAGPAPRSLDRFVIQAVSPDGSVKQTDAEGSPLVINGDETLVIDTGQRILGEPHA